jgi:hypothetical protein
MAGLSTLSTLSALSVLTCFDSFNTTAATTWFLEHAEGLPYGFANILTGWIDTNEANYPGNLNAKVHEVRQFAYPSFALRHPITGLWLSPSCSFDPPCSSETTLHHHACLV